MFVTNNLNTFNDLHVLNIYHYNKVAYLINRIANAVKMWYPKSLFILLQFPIDK